MRLDITEILREVGKNLPYDIQEPPLWMRMWSVPSRSKAASRLIIRAAPAGDGQGRDRGRPAVQPLRRIFRTPGRPADRRAV